MKIAICLFAYKRPEYLKRALKSHTKIDADYYAFIDYSDMQNDIFDLIADSRKYDSIICRPVKLGLNNSIIKGITEVLRNHDAVIVLEDDIVIDYDSLQWLHYQLWKLESYKHIGSVSLCKGGMLDKDFKCWGWATWRDRWERIEWTPEDTRSWDIQLDEYFKSKNLFCYCSPIKRSSHIGNAGTHHKWYSKLSIRRLWKWLKDLF